MKTWAMAAMLAAVTCLGLQAQIVVRKTAVPPTIVEEFESRFADAENVVWLQQGDQYYGARFQLKDQGAEAIYTPTGEWIQTVQDISYQEMPDSARLYCRTYYPEYKAKDVKKVSSRRHGILYEIKILGDVKQVRMTFDMHGGVVTETQEIAPVEPAQADSESMTDKIGGLLKKRKEMGNK